MRRVASERSDIPQWLRTLAAIVVALGLSIAVAAPASADCDALMPSFRERLARLRARFRDEVDGLLVLIALSK